MSIDYREYLPVRIDKTTVGPVTVATVLCMSGFTDSQVAETMIFLYGETVDGLEDQDGERGPVDEAQEQHDRWVEKVTAAVSS